MKSLFLISVLVVCCHLGSSQTKNEREERINFNQLPLSIQNLSLNLPKPIKRLKAYKETDGNTESYEIKFKYKRQFYSIEFNTNGVLEDIERLIKKHELPQNVATNIENFFTSKFKKTKYIKLQKQFIYKNKLSQKAFINWVLNETNTAKSNYEIITEVTQRKTRKRNLREFTFNHNGSFISFRTLVTPNYSHILYEN